MKLFFSIALVAFATTTFSQSTTFKSQSPGLSTNDKWDLNKYVWSQTHMVTKGDKPVLDFNAIDCWDYLDNSKLSISADGNYFAYGMYRGGELTKRDETIIVQSTARSWQKSYLSTSPGFFSADSKQYIFKDKNDLYFLQTGNELVRSVKQVASYKQSTADSTEWIAYQLKNSEASLVLQNLLSGKEKSFDHVASYDFDKTGKWLACQLNNDKKELLIYNLNSGTENHLPFVEKFAFSSNGESLVIKIVTDQKIEIQYLALPAGEINTVWSATEKNISVSNYSLDDSGLQLVFTVEKSSGKTSDNSIWYYKAGMNKAVEKVNNQTAGIENGFLIQSLATFTESGRYIQFAVQAAPKDHPSPGSDAVMLDVWNHKDKILQSTQSMLKPQVNSYKAVLNPETDRIIRLEKENEKLALLKADFAVIQKGTESASDRFWEQDHKQDSVWVLSLKDGVRRLLPTISITFARYIWFSPLGGHLVYLDVSNGCHYHSLDLVTGKLVKVSTGIPDWSLGYQSRFNRPVRKPTNCAGIVGWLQDEAILVYDNYDIWQLDLTGRKPPVNITNGYGRKHKMFLGLINQDRVPFTDGMVFKERDTLLLTAFNFLNKYNGFYRKILGEPGEPQLLTMGPYFFQSQSVIDALTFGMKPVRALHSNTWIVQRESEKEAPNYFLTTDFKTYKALTNLQSQKDYNWLTTELHSFKQLDGTISQGVLYKPENFDPSKKYPVIISFYSALSSRLYQFPTPQYLTNGDLIDNQTWMVSHGYLVFLPDIYFTKGQWGPSVTNTVVGAANYLSQLPYVDAKHMGAGGHSNGGRLGYYVLTHSNCFAAMTVSSGTTDMISNGLRMEKDGSSRLVWAETGFPGDGLGSLWKNKTTWLDHTSVLYADKVTSPLLIFQSKKDPSYLQGFEMFTALRRLEKEAWWLQYDVGGHNIDTYGEYPNEKKDYTIRYTQFYDHFLKGAPAPGWMTQGIPYELKGIESRLELDPAGKCSNNCKVCISYGRRN